MAKKIVLFLGLVILGFVFAGFANAQPVCPLCVVAVGGGLWISRWLGIDDVITSLWIGAFLLAITLWTIHWLKKKNWNFKFYKIVTFLFYYLFTYIPLYYLKIVGLSRNKIWGIDKIIFGSAVGTIVFIFGIWLNEYLKKNNGNKVYFPYQRVVVPFATLAVASIVAYFLI